MKNKTSISIVFIFSALLLLTACEMEDTPESSLNITVSTPNSFAKPLNSFPSLAAGSYTIVAATFDDLQTGSYTLEVNFDDGTKEVTNGQWVSSGGNDPASSGNPSIIIALDRPGGITVSLTSEINTYLYFLDMSGNVLFENDDSNGTFNSLISLPKSRIDNTEWSTAYYEAIDPGNAKDTLNKWRFENGFTDAVGGANNSTVKELVFRDTKDLGYGRRLFYRPGANGCLFVYVENFEVVLREGLPYSTLNLNVAADNDRIHHFGTNAIEFSPIDDDCNNPLNKPLFTKFYTFKADKNDLSADETRILSANLDGRGEIAVPISCVVCHGGTSKPLQENGDFASASLPGSLLADRVGDTNSFLQLLQLDTFEYSDDFGLSRAEQEANFQELNRLIYNTYPTTPATGELTTDFAREIADGWYDDNINIATNYDGTFVPPGWLTNASTEELFLKVVKPFCLSCHAASGTTLQSDINFSTYAKFIGYADDIEDQVYDRGVMPLSLLNFDKFWASDAPQILASHLPGFSSSRFNTDGTISQPGKPVARPGLDRTTNSPVILDASSSLFSNTYLWTIVSSPAGSDASLNDARLRRATFETSVDGEYVFNLVTGNGVQSSSPATLIITINNTPSVSIPLAQDITFNDHIKPVLQSACTGCHASQVGNPVYFTDSTTLYGDVLNLINFDFPEISKLLLKPTGHHHFNGMSTGFNPDDVKDRDEYNLFLNWILNGAREK